MIIDEGDKEMKGTQVEGRADIQFVKDTLGERKEKSGFFLWQHAIRTAEYLLEGIAGGDNIDDNLRAILYRATLGHDLLEDTEVTEDEVRKQWGDEVLSLVKALTNEDGHREFTKYIDRLKSASEEVTLIKLAAIYVNALNSAMAFDSLEPVWTREFWLPLLEKYSRALFTKSYDRYPKAAARMISDIETSIEALRGKVGMFKQFGYLHEFERELETYLEKSFQIPDAYGASIHYEGCFIEKPNCAAADDGLWRKALSEGESYVATAYLKLNKNGQTETIPYFNLPMVTPRGTFVIEGRERIPLKTFKLIEAFSPEFAEDEFQTAADARVQYDPIKLCEAVQDDFPSLPIGNIYADPVGCLNELLDMPDLAEHLEAKRGNRVYAKELLKLMEKTEKYRKGQKPLLFPPRVLGTIRRLNRELLERHYAKLIP